MQGMGLDGVERLDGVEAGSTWMSMPFNFV